MSDIDREYTVTDAPVRTRAELERDLREALRLLQEYATRLATPAWFPAREDACRLLAKYAEVPRG